MTTQALAVALSQAAFGAVTMMFIAYSTLVALKVDERDAGRERKQAKRLRKANFIGVPAPIYYVYADPKAADLSRKLRKTSTMLASMYVIFLGLSTLMISPGWLSPSAQSLAATFRCYGFSPHDPAILYTLVVVGLAWWIKRRCDLVFAAGRQL